MGEKIQVKVGFPGDSRVIEVEVPDGDERPWGLGTKLAVVGTDVPRLDGPDKVTGRAKYSFDINLAELCHAKILRSPHAAAVVKSIDLSAAEAAKGVVATLSVNPGTTLRHQGQEVAAVAANSEDRARDALAKIKVEYQVLPHVVTADEARKAGAPIVIERLKTNIRRGRSGKPPETDLALAKSDHVIEAVYRTQVQTHTCLETHGCVARWEEDGSLTVWASTQATGAWFGAMNNHFKLKGKVRVVTHHMGGGFGSKFGPRLFEIWCAELARKAGRPVKLHCERKEEHLATGNRPDSVQRLKGGVTKDGKITAFEIHTYGTAGARAGGARCANPLFYDVPVFAKTEETVLTNAGPACAMRAPGFPQGVFALDSFVDEIAAAVGLDPLELRRRNTSDVVRLAQYEMGAREIGWDRRKADGADEGSIVRGFGMANTQWFNAGGGSWKVIVKILRDGTVVVRSAVQDIGTGTRTVLAVAVAEELGIAPDRIRVEIGDTRFPAGPGSGGSTTAPSMFPAARNAGAAAWRALAGVAAHFLGIDPAELVPIDGKLIAPDSGKDIAFEKACALLPVEGIEETGRRYDNYAGYKDLVAGVQFAEVEVDRETGLVRVVKIVAIQDCGRVIDKLTAESQIIGAVIGGLSYALFEDRLLDSKLGRMLNPDMLFYKIAGAAEMPEIVPIAMTVANAKNNGGVMGLGEPPAIPTAAAIANGVANATGARVRELPITPDRVLAALEGD